MKILYVKVYLGANPSTLLNAGRTSASGEPPGDHACAREAWWNSSQRVRRGNLGNCARAASWGTHARFIEHDATANRRGDTGGRRVAGLRLGMQVFASFKAAGVVSIR